MVLIGDMMNLKFKKLTFMIFLTVLLTVQVVRSLGVTDPTAGINLLRGDSTKFSFQIQAVTSPDDQVCSYSVSGMEPLVISFDENEVVIKAGNIKNIYGTVSVPQNAEIKNYKGELTVKCRPQGEVSGSVIHRTMISDFAVNVVGTIEEKKIPGLPEEKMPATTSNLPIIIILIIIIILVIGVYYWTERKKK